MHIHVCHDKEVTVVSRAGHSKISLSLRACLNYRTLTSGDASCI